MPVSLHQNEFPVSRAMLSMGLLLRGVMHALHIAGSGLFVAGVVLVMWCLARVVG